MGCITTHTYRRGALWECLNFLFTMMVWRGLPHNPDDRQGVLLIDEQRSKLKVGLKNCPAPNGNNCILSLLYRFR